ncbi:MAG: histidine kinase N-terminal 7TM domain-containing protein, partial [Patescibacteria group bacterium]
MTYYSISALINACVSLLLGIFILYKNPKAKLNKALFFWCFTVAFWSSFYFIWQLENKESKALLWTRLLMLGAIWVPIAYFRVVAIFLNFEKQKKFCIIFNYIISIIFSLLLLTPLMVKSVGPVANFSFWPKPGNAYIFFLIMFAGVSLYSALLSYKFLKKVSAVKRAQLKFMLWGIAISIIGGSTNYFLWYDIPIKPYGNIFASTYVIMTVYAIVRYRLLDIKFVLRKS